MLVGQNNSKKGNISSLPPLSPNKNANQLDQHFNRVVMGAYGLD